MFSGKELESTAGKGTWTMIKATLDIEGMECEMCEAHICEVIRKAIPGASKVTASRKKNEATFLTEEEFDPEALKAAINETGYTCRSVESAPYEKKSFWQVFKKN